MKRRGNREVGWFGNPTLVGALTVLVLIVAVTLAYEANNGLPFVPRYVLRVEVANADQLTHGAEVRMGGALVGAVDSVDAGRGPHGRPIAILQLRLDKKVQPLPVNSLFTIRLKAAIGLKYVDVTPGTSPQVWADGATVPLTQTHAAVDLDQLLSMFNAPTRAGIRVSTENLAYGFASRGGDLNVAIAAFVPLLTDLGPVMRNLSASRTGLANFLRGLESFTGELVPVAQTQASLFVNLDTTFRALAGVAVPFLQETISQTPPTFDAVIADSPQIQPFLRDTTKLLATLQPGIATLPGTAPVLAQTFAAGARNLPGTAELDQQLVSLSKHLANYGETPAVSAGLQRLTLTASRLRSPLSFLTPVQATCNYATLFLRNVSSLLSENVDSGTMLRFIILAITQEQGGEGGPSQSPYVGPVGDGVGPLHVNPYPNTASPGQAPAECAAGNEPYLLRPVIGNPPGNLGTATERTTG